jgi:hypothetical protein
MKKSDFSGQHGAEKVHFLKKGKMVKKLNQFVRTNYSCSKES